jgi:hypothetical protein
MKNLFLVIPALFLFTACGTPANTNSPEITPAAEQAISVDSTAETVGAKLGETCGGLEKKPCMIGLECVFDFSKTDARGRCEESVVDKEMKCDKEQIPVCGQKGLQKNGYLNKCEALRHGATIISDKLCEIDPTVAGNCKAKAVSIGNCFNVNVGWEFDGKKCLQRNVGGCEAEIPFATEEDCNAKCQ